MSKKNILGLGLTIADCVWVLVVLLILSGLVIALPLQLLSSTPLVTWLDSAVGTMVLAACIYIISAFIIITPLYIARLKWPQIAEKLALTKPFRLSMVPWALTMWGLYFASSIAIVLVLSYVKIPWIDLTQAQNVGFSNLTQGYEYIAAFVALVILAPIFEELIFRGYLFGRLRGRYGFIVTSIVTSLVFAIAHQQINVGIDVFVLSMFMCYVREQFESIWPSVLIHMFKNTFSYILIFIAPLYGLNLLN